MGEKISVIIPIYKVEKYLNRCVDSVVKQSYQNLEIILVDDGSPDLCPKMCDEWAKKDNRIKVIHKENGGLSDARNIGMQIMTGEYVFFVDSDDWIHRDTLKTLKNFQEKYDADIVECKAFPICEEIEDVQIEGTSIEINRFDTKDAMSALVIENPLKQTVWNKLYKKSTVDGIHFEIGKYHEDEFWTYQVFDRAKTFLFVDVQLYYYFQRSDSIMGQSFSLKRLDAIEGRYRRLAMLKEKYPELVSVAKENLAFLITYFGQQALMANSNETNIYLSKAKKYIEQLDISVREIKGMSIMHKLWIFGIKKNLDITCKIRNILKIGIY